MHEDDPVYSLPPISHGPTAIALPSAGEVNWGMSVFQIERLRKRSAGAGVKLGIVDTGVDGGHPLLANVKAAKDFTGSAFGPSDRHGHGTHVTGTVGGTDPRIGVAPDATLYHGKGLSDSGTGGNGLMDAIEWCLSEGCVVVSNSWGGGSLSADWQNRFRAWADAGAWLIFAGGNSGPGTPDADNPGRSEYLINVAALNQDLSPASFSSSGDKLDTSGPGVNIWSARPGGGFAQMSGTSMATPFVAGMLGLYRRSLELAGAKIPKVHELREKLFARSTDTHTPGDDRRTGPGWVTPILLELDLTPDPPPVVG